ncbi:hypothetical protein [Catenovulum sediminis]|uniref:NAD/FAD-utilizing enzyme n=1 Tax=Catenovulum sediminis TaxID=1740262 RepID=A0ABV1RL13_9ALTE|nr:hypothetical protein [Catenovulum sediminis]
MSQFQFLVSSAKEGHHIEMELKKMGLVDDQVRFIGADNQLLNRHQLHEANVLEETDIVESSKSGATFGLFSALCFMVLLLEFQPSDWQHTVAHYLIALATFVALFAWLGALIGVTRENRKIAEFHKELSQGQLIMLIDCAQSKQNKIIAQILKNHPNMKVLSRQHNENDSFFCA